MGRDGLFDTQDLKDSDDSDKILLNDPGMDCFYEGEYLMGLKHGYGKIQCRIPYNHTVFEGEWRYNLPFRNSSDLKDIMDMENDNEMRNIIMYSRFNGGKIFEGSIMKKDNGE